MDEQIEFTMEREQEESLPFPDVAVRRRSPGVLQTAVYRKATHTDRVLNFHSHHSRNARAAVVHTLLNRFETHFSEDDMEGKNLERQHVFDTLIANDYPRLFVERIANKCSQRPQCDRNGLMVDAVPGEEERWVSVPHVRGTSEAITTDLRALGVRVAHRAPQWKWCICAGIKDQIPPEKRKGVVYRIPCEDCDAVYIGETLRTLPTRLQEHLRHTRKGEQQRSAIAENVRVCPWASDRLGRCRRGSPGIGLEVEKDERGVIHLR